MNTVFVNVPLGACLAYQLQETMVNPWWPHKPGNFVNTDNVAVQCSEEMFIDLLVGIDDKTYFDLTELNMLNRPDLTVFFLLFFFIEHTVIDKSES